MVVSDVFLSLLMQLLQLLIIATGAAVIVIVLKFLVVISMSVTGFLSAVGLWRVKM